jgi:hypothetical protein
MARAQSQTVGILVRMWYTGGGDLFEVRLSKRKRGRTTSRRARRDRGSPGAFRSRKTEQSGSSHTLSLYLNIVGALAVLAVLVRVVLAQRQRG